MVRGKDETSPLFPCQEAERPKRSRDAGADRHAAIVMSVWSHRTCERAVADGTSPQPVRCEKEKKSTVFLFPGLDGGDIWEFAPLLSMVDAPLHFVPIRYRHWSELQPEPDELDRLVTDCVSQIESHGPPSTIYLVGYSFGAQMIWAAARAM